MRRAAGPSAVSPPRHPSSALPRLFPPLSYLPTSSSVAQLRDLTRVATRRCHENTLRLNPPDHHHQVWVPSNFVREAFARGGVPLDKIRRVPETIDFAHFDPEGPVAKSAPRLFPAVRVVLLCLRQRRPQPGDSLSPTSLSPEPPARVLCVTYDLMKNEAPATCDRGTFPFPFPFSASASSWCPELRRDLCLAVGVQMGGA